MQFMAGGDLSAALTRDLQEEEKGGKRRLGWYASGQSVLLNVACGLAYLHSRRVRRRVPSSTFPALRTL